MIIKRITQLTAGTAIALALVAGGAHAQSDTMMSDDELVDMIQQEIANNPETNGAGVTVSNDEGMIRVEGMADPDAYQEIVRIIGDIEGAENVENAIVVQ